MKRKLLLILDGLALIGALVAATVLIAMLTGCAVPVRPIAKLVPQPDGSAIFLPDPENEPQFSAAAVSFLPSPYGELLAGGLTLLTAGFGAHARSQSKRAAEHKADADEGWQKAIEAERRAPPPPKETT